MEEIKKKETPKESTEQKKAVPGGKWFKKIPKEILLSPGGVILIFFAIMMEIADLLIPSSLVDSLLIELALEIPFCIMLSLIAKIPFTSQIIPLLIERIPIISDIIPTWFIRIFI